MISWLRLIRSRRVGPTTFHRLLGEHGTVDAALDALPEIAREAGVEDYSPCPPEVAVAELAKGRNAGATLLTYADPRYPALLREIGDAPPVLWVKGEVSLLSRPTVAFVGARNASSLGARMARRLAEGLGEAGLVIVSGLARGIDAAAHSASLPYGTIAVQAGGIDVCYPSENRILFEAIQSTGLSVTEQPPGLHPQARHFPSRNRIISGLCRAVVVVEAASRSGSLITARNALDQGREVLAVPGHPFDGRASGCNMLIRDGATLVRGPEDIATVLEAPQLLLDESPLSNQSDPRPTGDIQNAILAQLGPSPVAEDQLIRDLNRPAAAVTAELMALELDGRVTRQAGGMLSLSG